MQLLEFYQQIKSRIGLAHLSLLCLLAAIFLFVYLFYHIRSEFEAIKQAQNSPKPVIVTLDGKPAKESDPKIVYVQGQNTVERQVVYVPKETDPITGKKEATDVQLDTETKDINVKVNGHTVQVPNNVSETTKFENGKLVITETSQMQINIAAPKPSLNLGVGYSTNGIALQVNGPLYKSTSWWVYGDRDRLAGGIQIPLYK